MKRLSKEETKQKIDELLDEFYFDVQCAPGTGQLTQEAVVKLITKIVVSLCSAWWSITELMEYIRERQNFKEATHAA